MSLATTVIVPTYNRAHMIEETLASIFAQTRPVAEIIVADDGSTDDTASVLARHADRIRILSKPNSGKADTINVAITHATGDLIWIVDDDDLLLPNAHATLIAPFEADPSVSLSVGRYVRFHIDAATGAQVRGTTGYWPASTPETFLIDTLEDFFAHHPGLIVKRQAYAEEGPFTRGVRHSEDYDMLLRLARGRRCVVSDELVFLQRQHDGARGAAHQFAAGQREAHWIEDGRVIFRSVRANFALDDYLPTGPAFAPPFPRARAALLQRGIVMARKKLWPEALEDFAAAAVLEPAIPLTAHERARLRRALFSKYGCGEVLEDPSIAEGLAAIRQITPHGEMIVRSVARTLFWAARDRFQRGAFTEAKAYGALFIKLSPLHAIVTAR